MENLPAHKPKIPLVEKLKTIPDMLGIRLNEQPHYDVLSKEGDIEIRKYPKLLLAQVTIQGEHEEAIKEGFLELASYIFGENKGKQQLSMTAPVFQENQTMPMTAPVYQQKSGENWTVSFVIPKKFDRNTVPEPLNKDIHFVEVPMRKTVVYQYTGNNNEEKMMEAEKTLKSWLFSSGDHACSDVRWAQYDPPFAIPFLKRNEAQIDII